MYKGYLYLYVFFWLHKLQKPGSCFWVPAESWNVCPTEAATSRPSADLLVWHRADVVCCFVSAVNITTARCIIRDSKEPRSSNMRNFLKHLKQNKEKPKHLSLLQHLLPYRRCGRRGKTYQCTGSTVIITSAREVLEGLFFLCPVFPLKSPNIIVKILFEGQTLQVKGHFSTESLVDH